jgi:hypothetical protein
MAELLESFIAPGAHTKADCPFCPIQKPYKEPDSVVSDGNNSKTLGQKLNATKKEDDSEIHHFRDIMKRTGGAHGAYTVQAHHLICGNEILGEQKIIQAYLCKEGRHDGKLQPCDTGYDVNNPRNGIWLPSTPPMYKQAIKMETALGHEVPAGTFTRTELKEMATFAQQWPEFIREYQPQLAALGVNTGQRWTEMSDDDQDAIAFVVMMKKQRQFHLGQHGSAVPEEDKAEHSYVLQGIKHLNTLTTYVQHYSDQCPMEDGKPKDGPPYVPPLRLNGYLDTVSAQMRRYVEGDPKGWKYFISKWAYRLTKRLNAPSAA